MMQARFSQNFFFWVTTMGTSLAHYEADTEESSTGTQKVRVSVVSLKITGVVVVDLLHRV